MVHYRAMHTFRDFADEVLGPISQLPELEVPVTDALDCCAAYAVLSPQAVPSYPQAQFEGIAVSAEDVRGASASTPVILPLGGDVAAGTVPAALATGHCARMATFSQVPATTDAVIALDDVAVEDDKVVVSAAVAPGNGVVQVAGQFDRGDTIIAAGQRLDHIAIAQLALAGHPRIKVHPRPRVVVVTIGSELVRVSGQARPATVFDATGVLLTTTAASLGADCYRVGPLPDDAKTVRDTIEDQLVRADIVITAGGIDTATDVLRRELLDSGLGRFDGPELFPCSAYGIGRIGPEATPIIALPGDPASALLAFHALVRPVITGMLGREGHPRHMVPAPSGGTVAGSRVMAGTLEGGRFAPTASGHPALRDLAGMNAMAVQHHGERLAEVVAWPY